MNCENCQQSNRQQNTILQNFLGLSINSIPDPRENDDLFSYLFYIFGPDDLIKIRRCAEEFIKLFPEHSCDGPQLHVKGNYRDADKLYFTMPKEIPSKVYQIKTTITWNDQGWGNRKGRVMLILRRGYQVLYNQDLFGKVEHRQTTQEKILQSEDIVKNARRGDIFEFWRYVGRGGHELHILSFEAVFIYAKELS